MKKVLLAFPAACLLALVCAFTFPPVAEDREDYTRFHLLEAPMTDVPVDAYDCVTRAAYSIEICPGTGYRCSAKLSVGGAEVVVTEQKGKGRANVEINAD